MNVDSKNKFRPILFTTIKGLFLKRPGMTLFLITVSFYWPLAFFFGSVQYDTIDVVLAWRYYAAECFSKGIIPLWNPYQTLGYPFHADLQYPVWYPEVFFIGKIFGYSAVTLNILLIIYIFFGGLGMYKLAAEFGVSHKWSLLAGISFLGSGIFAGYAQSMVSVLAGTWVPWVLAYFMRLSSFRFRISNVLKFSLAVLLMLTGGYQAVSFMLFYLLIILFIYRTLQLTIKKDFRLIKDYTSAILLSAFIVTILCAGMFLSLYHVFPYIERLSGLTIAQTRLYSFTPQSLISLLLPAAVVKNEAFFGTSITMANAFIGSFMLIAGIMGLFKKMPGRLLVLVLFGILLLFASFGKYTPVQKIFFEYVPFMNLFKFPSFYRFFTMIAMIILAVYFLEHHFFKDEFRSKKWFCILFSAFFVIYLSVFFVSLTKINVRGLTFLNTDLSFPDKFRKSTLYENLFLFSGIQIVLYSLFYIFYFRWKFNFSRLLIAFSVIELFTALQINSPVTVYSSFNPFQIKESLLHLPEGFPVPDRVPVKWNSDKGKDFGPVWRNMGNYTRQPSWDGFTSFILNNYNILVDSFPRLTDSILENHLVYLTDDIRNEKELFQDQVSFGRKTIFTEGGFHPVKQNPASGVNNLVYINSFSPHRIECNVEAGDNQWLVLLQSNYTGWKVFVDGRPAGHYTVNKLFMGLPVPAGKHKVVFLYNLKDVKTGFYIEIIGFLILLSVLIFLYHKNNRKDYSFFIFWSFFILVVSAGFYAGGIKNSQSCRLLEKSNDPDSLVDEKSLSSDTAYVFLYDKAERIKNGSPEKTDLYLNQSFREENIPAFSQFLDTSRSEFLHYYRCNVAESPLFIGLILEKFPEIRIKKSGRNVSDMMFGKNVQGGRGTTYAFRDESNQWHINIQRDSTEADSGVYIMKAEDLWGPSFSMSLDDLAGEKDKILIFSGRTKWISVNEVLLVLQVERNNKLLFYKTFDLNRYDTGAEWFNFAPAVRLSDHYKENDVIKVYFWNRGGAVFKTSNLKTRIVSLDEKVNQ